MTTPTLEMLRAIASATLHDDVYAEDPTTWELEKYMAELTGHEAALFVPSGTMGNQIALRGHLTQPPYGILCDGRAHIMMYEAGATSAWTGATVKTVLPRNNLYLTLEDVEAAAVLSDDVHVCPTKVVCLENTLNGLIMPLEEVRRISDFCRREGLVVHVDGARLWEAAVAHGQKLSSFASLSDSVSLCFSKGLGAPVGSVLVGQRSFIKRARHLRKAFGGGLRQIGVLTAAARVSVIDTFLANDGDKLRRTHEIARDIAAQWMRRGGSLVFPVQTNMVWLDLTASGISVPVFIKRGRDQGLKLSGGRLVVHYQISQEALSSLFSIFDPLLCGESGGGSDQTQTHSVAKDVVAGASTSKGQSTSAI